MCQVPRATCAEGALRTHRYAAAEWCYNVEDGCRRYAFDADLDLFLAALQGHAPETAWRQQQELLRRLLHALRAADPASREEAGGGWCSPDAVMAAVAGLWPHLALPKERQLRQLLADAAEPGHSGHGPAVQYEELLADHEESGGDQSAFAELLRKAHAAEPRDFMRALHTLLRARDGTTARDSALVTAATVRGVILLVDPGRPADNVRAMLSLGFSGPHGKASVRLLSEGAQSAFVGLLTIDPGVTIPVHRDESEEFIYMLEGGGTISIDGVASTVSPGDFVFMPAGAEVTFSSTDAGSSTALQIFAPPESAAKYDSWQ